MYGKQARYGLSDRYLRAALGYIQEDQRLLAAAYFYLGYANYALAGELADKGRAIDAVKFSKRARTWIRLSVRWRSRIWKRCGTSITSNSSALAYKPACHLHSYPHLLLHPKVRQAG